MILCKSEILKQIEEGGIYVDPFDESLVSVNSIDIRLGEDAYIIDYQDQLTYKYRKNLNEDNNYHDVITMSRDIYNPLCRQDIKKLGKLALMEKEIKPYGLVKGFNIPPRGFMIGTTLESIGTVSTEKLCKENRSIIPKMYAKSTTGRHGLTVALCAGVGDVHYHSRWALEVHNNSNTAVFLAVGTVIGQVVFSYGTRADEIYDGPDRYQNKGEVEFVPKNLKIVLP